MFLFVVTDLYDLNNSRVLVEYLSSCGYDVTVYFCTTPLKAYRRVFFTNQETLVNKVEMSDKVKKHVGSIEDFNSFMTDKKFKFTFICCSYYYLFQTKTTFFNSRKSMGKLCLISWGFDGLSQRDRPAYQNASHVFAEGPFFFDNTNMHFGNIIYSHPYYDVFSSYSKEFCREKLGIQTSKKVMLIPETGNIKNIKTKWVPLYRHILKKIDRDKYYVVFKARQKLVENPCRNLIERHVDQYIENEWIYPPCSAVAAMASDACFLPCDSKYVLEAIMSKIPTMLFSAQGEYKKAGMFIDMTRRIRFDKLDALDSDTNAERNFKAIMGWAIVTHKHGNCNFILKKMGLR